MQIKYTNGSSKKRSSPSSWENMQWIRLICSVLLFLAVFLGKQIYPEKIMQVGGEIVSVLGKTTDFKAVFSDLGSSLYHTELLDGIEEFCVEVFGAEPTSEPVFSLPEPPNLPQISSARTYQQSQRTALQTFCTKALEIEPIQETENIVPPVGTVLLVGEQPSQPLPDGYTTDKLSFGDLETVTPVFGNLNSGFGYRDHPINGTYSFHSGTDIRANSGDPILAFAAGQVEYIGEDDSYGLYLQLDHGNGIKSFYAHCQRVCVQKGQTIQVGERIAEVGSSGRTTGPHLHLELKCGDMRVNPAYYISFSETA